MVGEPKPHVLVAGPLPSTFPATATFRERLREAGLAESHADSVTGAGERLPDGTVDVLVVAGDADGAAALVDRANDHDVRCCVLDDASLPGADTAVDPAGPNPVATLVGVVHELAEPPAQADAIGESVGPAAVRETEGTPPSTARVLNEAPVGITVADVTHPDQPLVYVNDKFVEQTGYDREIAIGRNCRFMQGPATEDEPVRRMREAIDAGESVRVELRNYDRSGEMFWQAVSLAPIRDESGRVTHYAGFQNDITQRKRAELAAERHRAALAEERETLRTLLDRLDGLVEQVTGAVVEAQSRPALGEAVCSRLGTTYAAAWLATYDPATERIEPEWTAVSTLETDPAASLGSVPVSDPRSPVSTDGGTALDGVDGAGRPEPALLSRAVEDRTVAVAEDAGFRTDVGDVAAVPVTYRGTLFGLFCVYTDADTSLGREERAVLAAIGRTIGVGLNAIDSQSSLTTDSGFEVEFTVDGSALPLARLAERADCSLRQAGVVPGDDGRTVLCTAADATAAALRDAADAVPGVRSWTCITDRAENPLFAFALRDLPLLDAVETHGLRLADLQVDGGGVTVVARGEQEATARSLVDAVETEYGRVDVRGFRERPARETTLTEFVVDVEERLTDRQHRALATAIAAGYFEWPRETDGDELAESFGVARSTFHQHLRAALRKLLTAFDEAVAR
ncbi:bacterio-opsin activator domain-containing protein [Halolamina rubra]|uniref:bacterio-opsin activator domain-containing protein n=1 Tax=Halolamina rubra TaxID=1380430 RepID=UPI0009E3C333|nr:bacterio-opsin activator domain-containing protein [Halolamina rubra]